MSNLKVFGVLICSKLNKQKNLDDKSCSDPLVGMTYWLSEKYIVNRDVIVDMTNFVITTSMNKTEG